MNLTLRARRIKPALRAAEKEVSTLRISAGCFLSVLCGKIFICLASCPRGNPFGDNSCQKTFQNFPLFSSFKTLYIDIQWLTFLKVKKVETHPVNIGVSRKG
jgi:hypothetical protein